MNNTKTLAIVAIFMAATLVVGTFAATATTTTQTALAYQKKKRGGSQENSKNGNTVTLQACKQKGSVSGHDNTLGQECQNVICTHPGSGATCVSDPGKVTPPPTLATGTATLLVKKIVECNKTITVDGCETAKFTIKVLRGSVPIEFALGNNDTQVVTFSGTSFYEVSEPEVDGFTAKFSGDCRLGIIQPGDHKTCTITNTEEE
jgi:hypothetical protein